MAIVQNNNFKTKGYSTYSPPEAIVVHLDYFQ